MNANRAYDWVLKPQDAEVVKRLITDVLLPGSEKIRGIASKGSIPIVVFEPMAGMQGMHGAHGSIKAMTSAQKRVLSQFPETKKWLDKKYPRGMVKVLAIVHMGSLCLNWVSGYELYVEPGTLDEERS